MLLSAFLLVISLAVLTFGAEVLVRGAAGLARKMGVSSFFIGLTIVGFGTSTPELATGLSATLRGFNDINVGNVVGSNICNIALILGLTALINPIPINTRQVRNDVLIMIAVSFLPLAAMLHQRTIWRWEGALLFATLLAYLWRGYRVSKAEAAQSAELEQELDRELGLDQPRWWNRPLIQLLMVIVGIAVLTGGSNLLVYSAVDVAQRLGISELIIALTVISFGTSAPELVTSLVAAWRKQSDISVGNILGSNIFNILAILSITSMVKPQRVNDQVLFLDTPIMILASLACLPILLTGRHVSRLEGSLLFGGYVLYVLMLYWLAPQWFPTAPPVI